MMGRTVPGHAKQGLLKRGSTDRHCASLGRRTLFWVVLLGASTRWGDGPWSAEPATQGPLPPIDSRRRFGTVSIDHVLTVLVDAPSRSSSP